MLGRATLTIDASRTTMNCATQSRINAVQRFSRYSWADFIAIPFDSSDWSGVCRLLAVAPMAELVDESRLGGGPIKLGPSLGGGRPLIE